MTPVVIDASAGVELAADTVRGRALRGLLPAESVPWVPDHFFVECGSVLRRWDLNCVLPTDQIATGVAELTHQGRRFGCFTFTEPRHSALVNVRNNDRP